MPPSRAPLREQEGPGGRIASPKLPSRNTTGPSSPGVRRTPGLGTASLRNTPDSPPLGPSQSQNPAVQHAASSLAATKSAPKLERLNAGKGSKACSNMGEVDPDDCPFYVLPGPASPGADEGAPDPELEAQHQQLLERLPKLQARMRSKHAEKVMEAAGVLRELSQGSSGTVTRVAESGIFLDLVHLLEAEDVSVVEEVVMAVCHFARHAEAARRLVDSGVMAGLSSAFVRAGEMAPRPHFSIQGNVCAAYLMLSAATHGRGAAIIFTGGALLRGVMRLGDVASGCGVEERRDALRMLLLLVERAEAGGKILDYGALQVAVETVEAGDTELHEEVTALLHIFSKMDRGGRQICGLLPVPQRRAADAADAAAQSISLAEEGALGGGSSLSEGSSRSGSSSGSASGSSRGSRGRGSGSWQTPGIAEGEGEGALESELGSVRLEGGGEEGRVGEGEGERGATGEGEREVGGDRGGTGEGGEGEGGGEGRQGGSRCLAAVCRLLSLDNTQLTLELALSLVARLVTRGMPEMIRAVQEQPGMLEALTTVYKEGSGSQRSKKKAFGLISLLKKYGTEEERGGGSEEGPGNKFEAPHNDRLGETLQAC